MGQFFSARWAVLPLPESRSPLRGRDSVKLLAPAAIFALAFPCSDVDTDPASSDSKMTLYGRRLTLLLLDSRNPPSRCPAARPFFSFDSMDDDVASSFNSDSRSAIFCRFGSDRLDEEGNVFSPFFHMADDSGGGASSSSSGRSRSMA